nr:hypothetical protein [Bacillus licheniformis]
MGQAKEKSQEDEEDDVSSVQRDSRPDEALSEVRHGEMADAGRATDFFGPYSPYMEFDSFKQTQTACVHLYTCQDCTYEETVEIETTEA